MPREILPAGLPPLLRQLDAATAAAAAFPLGGIGTGNISLGSRGEFLDWEIWGRPGKGNRLPYTFAALWCRAQGQEAIARCLEARLRSPYQHGAGLPPEQLAGLPRLAGARMRGEYPLVRIEFEDPALPVQIALEAFTPMVPLDAAASGLPLAYVTYHVTNPGPVPVDVTIALTMSNPVGWAGPERGPDGRGGRCHNRRRDADGLTGIVFAGERYGPDELRHGTAVLATDATSGVTIRTAWERAGWWDGPQAFWDDFAADGALVDAAHGEPSAPGRQDVGSLGVRLHLEPGARAAVPFILAWHFPNRAAIWDGDPAAAPRTTVHYATAFDDAWAVATEAHRRRAELTDRTVAFHRALFGGTLPPAVIDAAASNLAVLRSTTCFWLTGDGRDNPCPPGGLFFGWEGCGDQAGCCAGDCTHVWNYAQAGAFLYPELERNMRATEFGPALHADGQMDFRVLSALGGTWDHIPAVDGQHGSVLRLYREWRLCGDRSFLAKHYPAARQALEFAAARWDPDGDGLPEAEQHNTYDINFYGPNPLGAVLFLAGLRAGEELARAAGDAPFAAACRERFRLGRSRVEEVLWNGRFYVQRTAVAHDGAEPPRYQFGTGCLSDQLLGQLLAHVAGLGHLLDPARVRQALAAIYRHNFRPSLVAHASLQRTYALNDEAGLLLCSWPDGGRPRYPFPYADEVWTGIEYQVAAHLIYEGLVDEGLEIVAATRARHAGPNRNPWDEFECGHHYARALASYAVPLALIGLDYDASRGALRLAPKLPGRLTAFFSLPAAWGVLDADGDRVRIEVCEGRLALAELWLQDRRQVLTAGAIVAPGAPLEVCF